MKEEVLLQIVEQVKKMLKVDDDSKIKKFFSTAIKIYNRQILERKSLIEDNNEKIEELENENLQEALYKLDIDKVSNTESRKTYVETYFYNIIKIKDKIDNLKDNNKDLQFEIDEFQYIIDILNKTK